MAAVIQLIHFGFVSSHYIFGQLARVWGIEIAAARTLRWRRLHSAQPDLDFL